MSPADKIAEAKALIPDAVKLAFETRALGHNAREAGRKLAFAYSERVQKVIDAFPPLADLADAQAQENARLQAENERLRKMLQPEWFYAADGYESEACRWSVGEVLDEDYFWDRPKTGQHVVEINVATALPSIWAAVRFTCECADPDECECDNDMIVTEHASEAEARAALGDAQ